MLKKYSWLLMLIGFPILILTFNANAEKCSRWLYDRVRAVGILDRMVDERNPGWLDDYNLLNRGYMAYEEFMDKHSYDEFAKILIQLRRIVMLDDCYNLVSSKSRNTHMINHCGNFNSLMHILFLEYWHDNNDWFYDLMTFILLRRPRYFDSPGIAESEMDKVIKRHIPGLNMTALYLFSQGKWGVKTSIKNQFVIQTQQSAPETDRLNAIMTGVLEDDFYVTLRLKNGIGRFDKWVNEDMCEELYKCLVKPSILYFTDFSSIDGVMFSIILSHRSVNPYGGLDQFCYLYFRDQSDACDFFKYSRKGAYGYKLIDMWYELLVQGGYLSRVDAAFFRHFVYELTRNPLPYQPDDPKEPLLQVHRVKDEL